MPCFVLRFRGEGSRPDVDAERIAALPDVEVIDDTPRMLLVDGPEDVLRAAVDEMPDWVLSVERRIPLPDVRRRPRSRS